MLDEGHSTLPASCPVCEHSPLSADDCKIHKSLRTTVRVFLRSEEKKKDNLKLKEAKEQATETKEVKDSTPSVEASQDQVEDRDEAEAQPAVEATHGEEQNECAAAGEDAVQVEDIQEGVSNGIAQVCSQFHVQLSGCPSSNGCCFRMVPPPTRWSRVRPIMRLLK